MSSQTIVRGVRTLIQNKLLPHVPVRWDKQVRFGLEAYALREFASATSNARMVVANPNTASSKARRLLGNMKLAKTLGVIFNGLGLVRPSSYVNIDHSDMNGLMVLAGAVQTRHGRALPCLLETTYSERLSGRNDELPRKRQLRWDMQASRPSPAIPLTPCRTSMTVWASGHASSLTGASAMRAL